ncbi:carbohydrate kinase family protein [Hamadaea tsunoensis]|uniref:carbohydrate kinase family protein n=1 Tax=Hamadaea tsunoensis TaxID=53368 RepID=UPI0003FA0538|nr:carbohydrate kinase family protein [Hamadaea tsunoensis]
MTVVCVGDIITDVVAALRAPLAADSDTPARIRVTGGGQAANTAAWLAAAGADAVLVGAVGDDQAGRDRITELTGLGVRVRAQVCPGVETGAIVILSGDGVRSMVTDRGANELLAEDEIAAGLSGGTRLHLSAYTLLGKTTPGLYALAQARTRGLAVSVDAASAQPLRELGAAEFFSRIRPCDLLFANREEAEVLAGPGEPHHQALVLAAEIGGGAVVKLGAAGAVWALPDGELVRQTAPETEAVDTTGAGDAFAAGLLAALDAGADPRAALKAAVDLGARAVTRIGARP